MMQNRVREYRLRLGLTQSEVCRRAHLAAPNLSSIENNRREAWPLARMRLAKALKCTEAELFPGEKGGGQDAG
jgi:transcriptional regulator with XRE-family HTH domain